MSIRSVALSAGRCGCEHVPMGYRQCLLEEVISSRRGRGDSPRQGWSVAGAIEAMLCRRLGVRWVRLRMAHPAAGSREEFPDEPGVLRLPAPVGPTAPGFQIEVALHEGQRLTDGQRRLLDRTIALCAMVAEVERRGPGARAVPFAGSRVRDGAAPLIGSSPAIRDLRDRIERVAGTDFTVLIEGESGTGKELVARQIHELSRRRRGPFIAVNCAAIVDTLLETELFGIEDRTATGVRGRKGKFEHAAGGTLFLDEVADLSLSAQAKLLRAIQDCTIERVGGHESRHVDTRLVAATNRRLRDMVEQGQFRNDLFYRLSGVELSVPALRSRRDDVIELAQYFLARFRSMRALRLSSTTTDALLSYDWPGNVRELERLIEAVVATARGDVIEVEELPAVIRGHFQAVLEPSIGDRDTLRAWAGRYVRLVLHQCGFNKREACERLDISYHTLQTYLARESAALSPGFASANVLPPPLEEARREVVAQ